MVRASVHFMGFVCCLLAGFAAGAEPRLSKFTSYQAGDTHVLTSRSGAQARALMDELAKFRVALEKMIGRKTSSRGIPTYIVIVSASEWEKLLQPRQNVIGWFQPSRFANYILMNGDSERDRALHLIFHEYTHYYLRSQFAGVFPPWFNEGLAEVMGSAKFTNQNVAIIQVPMSRVYEARDGQWIPFDRLLLVDHGSPEYVNHTMASDFYAQAWLTVHYGFVENRQFGSQILDYLAQLNRLVPQQDAARAVFGDLAAVDKQLRDYSHNTRMGSGSLNLGEVPAFELGEGKPVAELDVLAQIIDLNFGIRAGADRLRSLIESFARREPKSARTAIFKARLASYTDDNAAFDRAISEAEAAIAPGDWQSRRALALALLASALDSNPLNTRSSADSERDMKRALRWFGEALAHNIDDVESLWGLGTAATRLNESLDLAEEALLAANRSAPGNASIAVSLANLYGVKDEPEKMVPFLKDSISYATDLRTREWATETLQRVETYVAEKAKVDAENRKQREEYERALAEYEKKYGKKKKK
jgi:hypothetical protein